MIIEFEFSDGSFHSVEVANALEAWDEVDYLEAKGLGIVSAWRDDMPWFGLCNSSWGTYD